MWEYFQVPIQKSKYKGKWFEANGKYQFKVFLEASYWNS